MKTTTRTRLITVLSILEPGDIQEAYALVKEAKIRLSRSTIQSLRVGDMVSFPGRKKEILKGTITKINRTAVQVRVDKHSLSTTWAVAVSLLKKI